MKGSKPRRHLANQVESLVTAKPPGGDEQPVLPLPDEYVPKGQRWHCTEPACDENIPAGHWIAAAAAIGADAIEPAGTIVHCDVAELVKNPGLQGVHCGVAMVSALYPGRHVVHAARDAEPTSESVPTGHAEQAAAPKVA